jgi:poly(3-hydroxybutyrate) depolymerase
MRLRPQLLILLLCLVFTLRVFGGTPNTMPTAEVGTLSVDGYTRSYLVYAPKHLPKHPAIVLMLHGRGGNKRTGGKGVWVA